MKSRDGKSKSKSKRKRKRRRREGKRREEKRRRKKLKKRKLQKKEDPGVRKSRKVATLCFSNDLWLRRVAGARDCALCQKWAKRGGFVAFPKTMAGVGHLKRICKDAFSVAGATRDMFIRVVRRSGRWFPERGCILEHQISRFAEMILRDRCSTSYDLASLFRGRRSTLDRWSGKIAKRIGTRPSALHSTFHFWRKSRRIASFLMLSSSKIEEVSQNCFVLDEVPKLKKSRRISRCGSLQIDR